MPGDPDFAGLVSLLALRREAAARHTAIDAQPTPFDDADVVVVDYDLTELREGAFVTGEQIAYLARCFTSCGVVVGLNQFKAGFDLTLAGHPDSYADVNIRSDQAANPGLWSCDRSGFRPWSWPEVLTRSERYRSHTEAVSANLDERILDFLGLSRIIDSIPRAVLEFLEIDSPPEETTFRSLAERSDLGARVDHLSDDAAARISVARVTAWLTQSLLPAQEVLIDAPHLVARIPALMARAEIDEFRDLELLDPDFSPRRLEPLNEARFELSAWLDRPCWYWAMASELASDESQADHDVVFCEDLSKFVPRAAARPFVAELPTPYRRRYVFEPETDLGRRLAETENWNFDPVSVDYRPAIRFAL